MPEFPEIEACDERSTRACARRRSQRQARHRDVKTFDPPLGTLESRSFAGAERRGKHLLFPTDDGELVLHVHLMSAGRLRFHEPGEKQPKTRAARARGRRDARPHRGAGPRSARRSVSSGPGDRGRACASRPRADELDAEQLAEILQGDSRRLHAMLRDQRVVAGIGRAWVNEILHRARLALRALGGARCRRRLADAIETCWPRASSSASAACRTRRLTESTTTLASRASFAVRRSRRRLRRAHDLLLAPSARRAAGC